MLDLTTRCSGCYPRKLEINLPVRGDVVEDNFKQTIEMGWNT